MSFQHCFSTVPWDGRGGMMLLFMLFVCLFVGVKSCDGYDANIVLWICMDFSCPLASCLCD